MTLPETIRAVTFDVGATLIEPWPSVGHVYAEVATEHGFRSLDPQKLTARFQEAWRAKENFDYSRGAWRGLVTRTFEGIVPAAQLDEVFTNLYERFERPEVWRVFNDVIPAFEGLRAAGFKLGVISNWDERLRRLLEGLRLSKHFEVIVISCEAGRIKPAAEIFIRAAEQFALPPSAVLHVGDELHEDVEGARAAGLVARLLQRGRSPAMPGSVASLAELFATTS